MADDNTRRGYDRVLVDIVEYVYNFTPTSDKAWRKAKIALLDSIACTFESLQNEEARSLIGPYFPGTERSTGARLPGTDLIMDPMKAAFDLGSLIRFLDHNDAMGGMEWGHPSDNIGAILPIADWLDQVAQAAGGPRLKMETVLEALIKAYEVQGCLQQLNAFNKVGIDHTILVRVASTAVVSWLLGNSEAQALSALSHAWMDGGPLRTFRQSPNTGPRKGWAAGDACMRAVQLCMIAGRGQPGAPTALSAPKWGFYDSIFKGSELLLKAGYGTFMVEHVFFKCFPVEGHAASGAEAALELSKKLRQLQVDPVSDVELVKVRTQQAAMTIINKQGPLHNAADRDHCMQYIIAVIMVKGEMIEVGDYQDGSVWAQDPRVESLRARIEMVEEPQFTQDYHAPTKRSVSTALTVVSKDGQTIGEVLVEYPMGHPLRMDTADAVKEKYAKLVTSWLGAGGKAHKVTSLAEIDLQTLREMEVSSFVDLLTLDKPLDRHLDTKDLKN